MKGWLDKYVPKAQNGIEGTMGGLTDKGFNYSPAWGGQFQDGGKKYLLNPNAPTVFNAERLKEKKKVPYEPSSAVKNTKAALAVGSLAPNPIVSLGSALAGSVYDFGTATKYYLDDQKEKAKEDFVQGVLGLLPTRFLKGYGLKGDAIYKNLKGVKLAKIASDAKTVTEGDYESTPFLSFAMGGSLPGSVGFTYARTGDIPDNGKYGKKTLASAQNGKKLSYNQWKRQYNLKETPDYNLKRAWELGYVPDKTGHLPTVDNQTGQFLKAKGHPTLQLEIDWYNSPEAADFRNKNTIDSSGKFFKYVPKGQNGQEMKYYQEGLDFQPRTISRDGKVIKDDRGQWAHPGEITQIDSNDITMQGVPYPVLGIGADGQRIMMEPGENYTFNKGPVTEIPMAQAGKRVPIVVSDPKDPRLKAYNDSLYTYKKGFELAGKLGSIFDKEYGYDKTTKEYKKRLQNLYEGKTGKYTWNTPSIGRMSDKEIQKEINYYDKLNNYEKQVASVLKEYLKLPVKNFTASYSPELPTVLRYKKPVQPVVYKKPEREPIIVNDPNDPKIKAYQDSLQVYNSSKFVKEHPLTGKYVPGKEDVKQMNINIDKKNINKYKPKLETTNTGYYYNYKKPVQPVEYRKQEPKKEPVVEKPVEKPTQKVVEKPVPPKPMNKYEGRPFYAPGAGVGGSSPLVGFIDDRKGDTTYIQPEDYERFAVDPRGRKYIESKKKLKSGGSVNNADAQPLKKLDQLLNFTNYNKPTKGGWLDKYN